MSAKKAVLVVDDHPLLRRGLTSLIDSEPNLCVCGEAASAQAALEAIAKRPPDLIIVDLSLNGFDGLELLKTLTAQRVEIPTLVLTMHDEAVYAERSLRAGARGYVMKKELDSTVLVAIRRLLAGERHLSPALEKRLAAKYVSGRMAAVDSPLDTLSNRELQVFRLIGQGLSTRRCAEALSLSVKTIESHREHIKRKLGLGSATELVHRVTQWVDARGRRDGFRLLVVAGTLLQRQ